ncbi:MAG TPA: prolyl oligopeptidase family serine peptidase, partial [Methylophilaceae bacterium]|nr:prolyl oligopeptidase family serine peptidase [Methylophilaceae bacterium]
NLGAVLGTVDGALKVAPGRLGIWGHSNGGSVALGIMEISGKNYPTVLWAPVTKAFPESILHFADEMDDEGAYLRDIVADFVQKYNPRLYSPPQYVRWLMAPVQLHQGTADEAVPYVWSDNFAKSLEQLHKQIIYYKYSGEDHNFSKGSWTTLVTRDLLFYRKNFAL